MSEYEFVPIPAAREENTTRWQILWHELLLAAAKGQGIEIGTDFLVQRQIRNAMSLRAKVDGGRYRVRGQKIPKGFVLWLEMKA